MPRPPLLALLLLLLLPAPAGAATPASAVAKVKECGTSLAAAKRVMVVQGRMRSIPGSDRMQIRFDLQAQTPDRPGAKRLAAPGLGVWNTADRGAGRYVYDKRVENLAAPADYRMVVRFRWLDADGATVEEARRVTRVCEQPDLRPDLSARRVTIAVGRDPGTSGYVVALRNLGGSPAGPFSVVVTVGDEALPAVAVAGLAAGGQTVVEVAGPRCASGGTLSVQVDSGETVEEGSDADNRLARTCP